MSTFRESIEVDVPAAVAWDVLADYGNDAAWRREVVSMVPIPAGPSRVGTTTDEVTRFMGSTATATGEVVALEPGRSLAWRASTPTADLAGERIVEALGDRRARVTLTYDLRPRGATRVLGPVLVRGFRSAVRANLRSLAALVAEQAPTA